MFAPKAPKPQRKTGGHSINQLEPQRSAFHTITQRPCGGESGISTHDPESGSAAAVTTKFEADRERGKKARGKRG